MTPTQNPANPGDLKCIASGGPSSECADSKAADGMYGISRIDDVVCRAHAWRVSLRRRGRKMVKNFSDKKCGGRHQALRCAKEYRDWIIKNNPPLSRIEFASILRKNNQSGVTGVCLIECEHRLGNGARRAAQYWEAIWPTTPGRHVKKRFSISAYGMERAFQMACAARNTGMLNVEGVFWPAERGLE